MSPPGGVSATPEAASASFATGRGRHDVPAAVVVATAAAAASLAAAPGLGGITGAGLALTACAIAVIDARRFIIPDELNLAGLVLALANAATSQDGWITGIAVALLRGAVLASIFFAIGFVYRLARGRDGVGLGDVKLAAVAGAWLDWTMLPVAVEAAALSALAMHLIGAARAGRPVRRMSRLPFGLFFAPAIWLAWLAQTLQLLPFLGATP